MVFGLWFYVLDLQCDSFVIIGSNSISYCKVTPNSVLIHASRAFSFGEIIELHCNIAYHSAHFFPKHEEKFQFRRLVMLNSLGILFMCFLYPMQDAGQAFKIDVEVLGHVWFPFGLLTFRPFWQAVLPS